MKIAFLHYHLIPGGVTRVIQQQTGICEQMGWQHCILAGENPLNLPNTVIIPELHYDIHRSRCSSGSPSAIYLADTIENSTTEFFQDTDHDDLIIHVHNATLAKNSDLLPALQILQKRQYRLFLQLHDFAEDGRPAVYSAADYPPNAHYGCINSRDLHFFSLTGLPNDRLHSIPNLVSPLPGAIAPEQEPEPEPRSSAGAGAGGGGKKRRFALYPVRGIRRKNLGELILLASLFDDITFGITLEPNNKLDIPSYRFWKDFASTAGIQVEFKIAQNEGFEAALARADFFVSTSVQEGFGFTFLEPWTLKKIITGRVIPYVNKDFVSAGMKMEHFYTDIPIPVDEINMDLFRSTWLKESKHRITRFAVALRNQGLDKAASKAHAHTYTLEEQFEKLYASRSEIDFARLDRENQAGIIRSVLERPQFAGILRESVPQFFSCPFSACGLEDTEIIENNYQKVFTVYGNEQYQQRLKDIYEAVLKTSPNLHPSKRLNKEILLESFLDPAQIFLITSQ